MMDRELQLGFSRKGMRIKRVQGRRSEQEREKPVFIDFLPTNLDFPNIIAQTMSHYSWT